MLLEEILNNFDCKSADTETYNHQTDFTELQENSTSIIKNEKEIISLFIASENLAHLLLSVKSQRQFFENQLPKEKLHQRLIKRAKTVSNNDNLKINARLFYKVYIVSK